jgi:peptide/nickel transport system permease protein
MTSRHRDPSEVGTTQSNNDDRPDHPIRVALQDRSMQIGVIILGVLVVMAVFGPLIAPYDPQERLRGEDGELLRLLPPSWNHWMGTTNFPSTRKTVGEGLSPPNFGW